MRYLKTAALAAALALAPLGISAAPIDLARSGYEIDALVEARDAAIDYDTISGFLQAADVFFELQVSAFDATNPATASFSLFPPLGPTADLFGSPASAFGADTDYLQYLFEDVSGSGAYAGVDGSAVLVELGAPGSGLIDGATGLYGTITVASLREIPLIPLPAGMVLLATGLAALGGVRVARWRGTRAFV